ncbi:thiamine diphosphokinase [Bacteroidota bacterium]
MKKVKFTNKFDAIICLDGTLATADIFNLLKGIKILAADGAAVQLSRMGIDFDKVIGDLDTLKREDLADKIPESKKVYLPDQDTNDFEKTLNYAKEHGLKNLMITGIHGGEFEHTLNNWSVFKRYACELNLCIYETGRYAIPVFESMKFQVEIGEMVSIIPQTSAVLTTTGLKWELKNEILEIGLREGARNIAENEEVTIDIHSGAVLVFINSRIPYAPVIY